MRLPTTTSMAPTAVAMTPWPLPPFTTATLRLIQIYYCQHEIGTGHVATASFDALRQGEIQGSHAHP